MWRIIPQNEATIQPGLNLNRHSVFHKMSKQVAGKVTRRAANRRRDALVPRHFMHLFRESRRIDNTQLTTGTLVRAISCDPIVPARALAVAAFSAPEQRIASPIP